MNLYKKINYVFDIRQKISLVILLIMILIGSILELIGVSAVLPLVSVAMNPTIIYENDKYRFLCDIFHLKNANNFILFSSGALCILYIVKNSYLIFYKSFQIKFTSNVNKDIAVKLMKSYLQQDYQFHVLHNVAELQRNITTDVAQFIKAITAGISLLIEVCTSILLFFLLVITDFMTTFWVIVILGGAILIYWRISTKLQYKYGVQLRQAGKELNKWFLQSFGGIKEIKVMNKENFFLENYSDAFKTSIAANQKHDIINMIPKPIMETILICSILLTMCLRILQGADIKAFVVTLSVFALAAIRLLPSFNRITEYIGIIMYNKSGVDSVFEDLKEIEKLERKSNYQKSDVEKLSLKNEIDVKNLKFAYPNAERMIFENASIRIYKNESVAFVGSSGAGKTTLADIIIGVLEPIQGTVAVDGIDIFTHLDAWHKTIGYIPQMIYLMDDTIRANVAFGLNADEIDDKKVWKALERAELADFVRSLNEGIYTEIGDRGVRLSGGQRQRIGIARALYMEPDVLILDEATSALDTETESAVMESIENLKGQTTLIIIAHRLSTIQNCDKVYEIENGEIVLKEDKNVQEHELC